MKQHEIKHKDHQRREDEVANLLSTRMNEIPTKFEKNRQHSPLYSTMEKKKPELGQMVGSSSRGRGCAEIEKAH